jgi:hypothetical protein
MIKPKDEFEQKIIEMFEDNFESLRIESGHTITSRSKNQALQQVILYWRKLHDLADKVTETEVKLILANQETVQGHKFSIEGIVDIVNQNSEVWLYDLKTHDPDFIAENRELYEQQLNVYAFIWQMIHQTDLSNTAVISTAFPQTLRHAIEMDDEESINYEMARWEPVIPLPYSLDRVKETIAEFANVVDKIEDSEFAPKTLEEIEEVGKTSNRSFVSRICNNCDARFSCISYREYVIKRGERTQTGFRKFFSIASIPDTEEQEEWLTGNLTDSATQNENE